MDFFEKAKEMKDEAIENRRYFHQTAEVGLDMPKAQEYIMNKLEAYGLHPEKCGHGVTALLGQGTPVLLLRADMDALPIQEDSGETIGRVHV